MKFRYHHLHTLFLTGLVLAGVSINILFASDRREVIILGDWSEETLEKLISDSSSKETTGEEIDFISSIFLGTPYEGHTLTGDTNTPEIFTVNLDGMDCFTYIDYVEAIRLSDSLSGFKDELKQIRYKNGEISFENRNHFFSDWPVNNNNISRDVTAQVGGDSTKTVRKKLNMKKDGTKFLPGIVVTERNINFIPSEAIDEELLGRLNTGDYVGIYTDIDGLDVTHTGIIIKKDDGVYMRHASSRKLNNQVVDENLLEYMKGKPGIVIYRPVVRR